MDLYDAIFGLKSTRKFEMQLLPEETLQALDDAIGGFARLYPDNQLQHRLSLKTKGMFGVTAPHYLIIGGSAEAGGYEAAGFLYQQANLWLSHQGLGSIWLGGARDAVAPEASDFVTIAFGRALASPHRSLAEFKRKPAAEATDDPQDQLIQAARLAPSGMNSQPWFFARSGASEGDTLVYAKQPKGPMSMGYKLTDLDIGIALANYAVAAWHFGRPFGFRRAADLPTVAGFEPFGMISA